MATESTLPVETGRELMNLLIAADVIGGKAARVIIDAQADDVMRIYVEHFGDERTRKIVFDVLSTVPLGSAASMCKITPPATDASKDDEWETVRCRACDGTGRGLCCDGCGGHGEYKRPKQ